MNCLEFRRARLSDPNDPNVELAAHRAACSACRSFELELRQMDSQIKKALLVDVPECLAAKILLNQSLQTKLRKPTRKYWLSMAASFFLAGVSLLFYQWMSRDAVETRLISHVEQEASDVETRLRGVLHGEDAPVSRTALQKVLNSVNLDLSRAADPESGEVVYAKTCVIDGRLVAHLVVKDRNHEITLVLVPAELVERPTEFSNEQWRGLISPHQAGRSIAILTESETGYSFDSMRATLTRFNQAIRPMAAEPISA